MKLFAVISLLGLASAAQLPHNSYIPPPNNALTAGGSNFLQTPHHSPSNSYLPPGQGGRAPQQNFNSFGQPTSFSHGSFGQQQTQQSAHQPQYRPQPQHHQQQQQQHHQQQHHQQQQSGPVIPILKYDNVNNGDGSYHFDYATGNGIMQQEQGHLNNAGSEHAEQVVEGSYSYPGDDGKTYTVHYKADGNGFQAVGDHLPTPPPIPEAIQRSIEYNAAHAGSGTGHGSEGAYVHQSGGGDQGAYSHQSGSAAGHGGYSSGGAGGHGAGAYSHQSGGAGGYSGAGAGGHGAFSHGSGGHAGPQGAFSHQSGAFAQQAARPHQQSYNSNTGYQY